MNTLAADAPPAYFGGRRSPLRNLATALALSALSAACAACSDDATSTSTSTPISTSAAEGSTAAGPATEGPSTVQSFTAADGTRIDYVLVAPDGRSGGDPGKVLLTFPPGGQDLALTRRIVDDRWADEALDRGWVVVSPAAPTTGLWYTDATSRYVPELLDHVAAEFPPAGARFDLAGVSNGGLSAFRAALDAPDRFRSLVVFPGYSPDGGDDPHLDRLAGIGVAMFVGGDDTGWRSASEATEAALRDLGATVELHVVEGQGHIIEGLTGADLFDAMERVRGDG